MANTFIFDDENEPDMGAPMPEDDDQPDDSESGNRSTFTVIAIVIGGIILVSLICIVVIAAFYLPQRQAAQLAANTSIAGTSTQNALVAQQTQEAALATPTLEPTPILTDTPSTTPVVVFATETLASEVTEDPATATVEALQTELASAQLTATFQPSPTTGTLTPALSQTGFADEVGLPGLFIVAAILLGVILLARRLRDVPAQ
jgi:hypothetical protein